MPDQTIVASQLEAALARVAALERQAAEQEAVIAALREDHAFREGVIEKAAEGVCVCHDIPEFPFIKFTVWNRQMTVITGYSMEEINRRGWYQSLYPDPELQRRARERMEQMRAGRDLRFERWEITRASGDRRLIAISTSVLAARDGSVHVLGLMHDFTAEERLQAQAALARLDELTGVKNRRGFLEDAGLLCRLAARQKQPVTVAFIDVDDLKGVNDALGHAVGDRVLRAVGLTLASGARSTDVVGRLGGDEFGVVYLGMREADAVPSLTRLHRQLLAAMREGDWPTSVSMGVVALAPPIPTIEEAIALADASMYRAKKEGKSRLVFESVPAEATPS